MKRPGFILANQLFAATIITVAIAFFAINYQALMKQKRVMDEHLVAARLVKEAADNPACHHFYHQGMEVVSHKSRIIVYSHGKMVMQLCQG